MFRDPGFAVRNLSKHLWLSLTLVVTLTLGIGISAGVFVFIDAQILRPQLDKDFDSFAQVYTAYTRDSLRPGTPGNTTLTKDIADFQLPNADSHPACETRVAKTVS